MCVDARTKSVATTSARAVGGQNGYSYSWLWCTELLTNAEAYLPLACAPGSLAVPQTHGPVPPPALLSDALFLALAPLSLFGVIVVRRETRTYLLRRRNLACLLFKRLASAAPSSSSTVLMASGLATRLRSSDAAASLRSMSAIRPETKLNCSF